MTTGAPGPTATGLTGRSGEVDRRLAAVGTIDSGVDEAAAMGVDMDDIGLTLADHRAAGFHRSYQWALAAPSAEAHRLSRR